MTNYEILRYAKILKISHFRGVYMADTLPSKRHFLECLIYNLDLSTNPGTHWCALIVQGSNAVVFDSFGLTPPPSVQNYLNNCFILYNAHRIQYDNELCGQLSLAFLYNFMHRLLSDQK